MKIYTHIVYDTDYTSSHLLQHVPAQHLVFDFVHPPPHSARMYEPASAVVWGLVKSQGKSKSPLHCHTQANPVDINLLKYSMPSNITSIITHF